MYKKPITQKAKSPLKQVTQDEAGNLVMSDTKVIKGTQPTAGNLVKKVEFTGTLDDGVYDALQKELDSGFAKRKYGFEGTDVRDYEKMKLGKMKNNVKITTTGTPGTPGTPDKEVETKKNLYTRDKTDAINPYGDYQNRLVENRAGRNLKSNARKSLNALARDYAYETADGDSKGLDKFLSNRKQMRDYKRGIAEGMSADQISQARELRKTKRGATALQTDLTEAQDALKRARNQRSQGASRDDVVIADDRVAKATDLAAMDVQLQKGEMKGKLDIDSAAKMRYQSNVGIKKHSPMKKGYFKNK